MNSRPLCIVDDGKATILSRESAPAAIEAVYTGSLAALYWNFVWSAGLKLGAGPRHPQGRLSEATDR
jgi:hypothetical protein